MRSAAEDGHPRRQTSRDRGWRQHALTPQRLLLTLVASALLIPIGWALAAISTAPVGQRNWYWQNPVPQGNTLVASAVSGAGDAWAVVGAGVILHSSDGGLVWEAQDPGTTQNLNGIDFGSDDTGWVVGNAGTIRRTIDGGSTWTTQTAAPTAVLRGVSAVDTQTVWAVGNGGAIRATSDGGMTWAPQTSNTASQLNAVSAVNTPRRASDTGPCSMNSFCHMCSACCCLLIA
jgi:photosystem II stability/assembly factor-like uncharacterized protein